jgi:hypothetical protein
MAVSIGSRNNAEHVRLLCGSVTLLHELVLLTKNPEQLEGNGTISPVSYDEFVARGKLSLGKRNQLKDAQSSVCADDVINLQFTSGLHV